MSAAPERMLAPALEQFAAAWHERERAVPLLADVQQRALDVAMNRGLPGARDEAFKYTSLRRFGTRRFTSPPPGPKMVAADVETKLLPASGWHRLVFVDGRLAPEWSTPFPVARGVSVGSLAELAEADPARFVNLLAADAEIGTPVFTALNAAFVADGALIHLDEASEIAEPIYIVHVSTGTERPTMSHGRVIVETGRQARAIIVEHHIATGPAERYGNVLTDVRLGPGARLEHYRLQEESSRAFHFARLRARLNDGASLVDHRIALGGALDRTDIDVCLAGHDAEVRLHGLFVVDGSRHVDTHTLVDHSAPSTRSNEDYRGLADDRGRGVFNGRVIVRPGAQKIAAHQSSRNLLLSENAEIDTKPELEIYADDVKCGHGATTGQLDPAALFYLRSRGLAENEARALLTHAFAATVIERMSLGPIREHLERVLLTRFRRAAGERA